MVSPNETNMKFVVPKVWREDAVAIFSRRRRLSLRRRPDIKKVELVHIPHYLHQVLVSLGNGERELSVCTDGICSNFSFFDAGRLEFSDEASGVVVDFLVSRQESERACLENLRWHLVGRGLRFKFRASLKEIREVRPIWYPYWVGYFKVRRGYDFRVADAVTGEVQGARMRGVFLKAFVRDAASGDPAAPTQDSPQSAQNAQRTQKAPTG